MSSRGCLGLGDPGHRRADHPRHLYSRLHVDQVHGHHRLEQADRIDVHLGEDGVVVVDVEEAQRPPEPAGHVDGDVGGLGHLDLGEAVAGGHQHPVHDQQVNDIVGHGLVDFGIRAAEAQEERSHPGQRVPAAHGVGGLFVRHRHTLMALMAPDRAVRRHRGGTGSGHRSGRGSGNRRVETASTYTVEVAALAHRSSPPGYPLPIGPRAVLIPVKAFAQAKRRLHMALSAPQRSALARAMADRVVGAAHPLPVAVVCDDTEVAGWARDRGALVVWEPGRGLNGAVEAGIEHLVANGVTQVTVAHADLPRASDLALVGDDPGITLVPDRYGNGTNVIVVPGDAGFRFSYGPGSFARHRNEAERLGIPFRVLDRPDLAWDIDEPGDVVPVAAFGLPPS